MRIAIIGAGITGLGAAWLLSRSHEVKVYEANDYLGGHANTVDVPSAAGTDSGTCPVDTGFIVYNTANYPNLIALFDHIGVETTPTNMSFAVSLDAGRYEYSGNGLSGVFAQPANLLRPGHWSMLRDIERFYRQAGRLVSHGTVDERATLGSWLAANGYARPFVDRHIVPMGAAIWSMPADAMLDFPVASFLRFFDNHGLLKLRNRPEWRTVVGGSREYVRKLRASCRARFTVGLAAAAVVRDADGVEVRCADGTIDRFDACLLACHADEALRLLDDPTADERTVLGSFAYSDNTAVLHRDRGWMPKRRRAWASWNYLSPGADGDLAVTYWMNSLQPLRTRDDWFVTLNPPAGAEPDGTERVIAYRHPVFDAGAIAAQRRLWSLQGPRRTWFAGSYFGYGFHEDGLQAGLAAAEDLSGLVRPWAAPGQTDRLRLPANWKAGYGMRWISNGKDVPAGQELAVAVAQ